MKIETKRYKISQERLKSQGENFRNLIESIGYKSVDGILLHPLANEDAFEVRVIVDPISVAKALELEELRDDEI